MCGRMRGRWGGGRVGWEKGKLLCIIKRFFPSWGFSARTLRYPSRLLSFKFIFGLRHMEGELTRSLNKSRLEKEVFI